MLLFRERNLLQTKFELYFHFLVCFSDELIIMNHNGETHTQIGDKMYYILKSSDVKYCQEHGLKKDKKETSHGMLLFFMPFVKKTDCRILCMNIL